MGQHAMNLSFGLVSVYSLRSCSSAAAAAVFSELETITGLSEKIQIQLPIFHNILHKPSGCCFFLCLCWAVPHLLHLRMVPRHSAMLLLHFQTERWWKNHCDCQHHQERRLTSSSLPWLLLVQRCSFQRHVAIPVHEASSH